MKSRKNRVRYNEDLKGRGHIMAKKDYHALAEAAVAGVGGKENIAFVMHCATRLRFQLRDDSLADVEALKAIPGVINVIVQNVQHQVVIGPDVSKAYDEVLAMGVAASGKVNDQQTAAEDKDKSPMDRVFEVISGIFTPIVPVLMAAGMMGAILTILGLLGVTSETSSTYYVFNTIYKAGFYFLPVFIGYSASQKFKCNPFLAMLLACVMVHPNIVPDLRVNVSDFQALGVENLTFFGLTVPAVSYAQSVLPIILGVWVMSYVDKFFNKIYPDICRSFMAPVSTMAVMTPLMLMVIGPLGTVVGNALGGVVVWLGEHFGALAVAIIAGLMPLMIATGTHSFAFPVIVTSLMTNGFEGLIMPAMTAENLAMAGAGVAVALMSKDAEKRGADISASISAVLGISEPVLYGVNIPSGHGFAGSMIGSAIGGLVAGIGGLRYYMLASASVLGIPAMFDDAGTTNVVVGILTCAVSFAAAFAATWFLAKTGIKIKAPGNQK